MLKPFNDRASQLLAGTLYFLRIWLCHKILFWQKAHFLEIFGKNTCCIVCLFVSASKDISVFDNYAGIKVENQTF